jgi:hypothetical protein
MSRYAHNGGGEWWRFLIEKPGEIPDQARLFFRSYSKGHGISTLASIGNWIHSYGTSPTSVMVPLDRIILWHPVRGESEREDAGRKTTERKEKMIEYFASKNITTESIILTDHIFDSIPKMSSADKISAVMVTPLQNDVYKFIKAQTGKNGFRATRHEIGDILQTINDIKTSKTVHRTTRKGTARTRFRPSLRFYDRLDSYPDISRLQGVEPFYIVSSGQGRLQAVKEAVMERGIDPGQVHIELLVYNVPRNLCSLFLVTGNEYRKDGYFKDARHLFDNKMLPSAESCHKDGTHSDDILSIYREIVSSDRTGVFDRETFVEGKYSKTPKSGSRHTRRRVRR